MWHSSHALRRRLLPWVASLLLAALPTGALAARPLAQQTASSAPQCELPAPPRDVPAWLKGAVVYGVVPSLFGGGTPFREVTARLDALATQGVDVLWLAPVQATDDPGAISYAITDYLDVRDDFGTDEDLRQLVREAKRRGMRVILDFVPNHTSVGHPFYKDAQARGPASPYYDYYVRDAQGEPQHYFDWKHLKNLNYDNPAVARMMREAFAYYVREFDVDGFRVDAAWGIRQRNPDFWPQLGEELRRLKPDLFLLAEASARDPYYVRNGFDAAYDWTPELGKWAWEHAFDVPAQTGARLAAALQSCETPPDRVLRFLNNNDTGPRFITRHGVATTRVAAVLVHTLPGIPLVYTGDEVGAQYHPYDDPPAVAWKRDRFGLRALYRKLARLREELPALSSGTFTPLQTGQDTSTFAFLREAGEGEQALVVLHFGKAARSLELTLPPTFASRLSRGAAQDALTGERVALRALGNGRYRLTLPATSARILTPTAPAVAGSGPE